MFDVAHRTAVDRFVVSDRWWRNLLKTSFSVIPLVDSSVPLPSPKCADFKPEFQRATFGPFSTVLEPAELSRVLVYVHSGCLRLTFREEEHELGPLSFAFYESGADLELVDCGRRGSIVYRVECIERSEVAKGIADSVAIGKIVGSLEQGVVDDLMNELVVLSLRNDAASRKAGTILLRVLLSRLRGCSRVVGGAEENGQGYSAYLRALDVIRERFAEIRSVAEIANAVRVSAGHLARLFREFDKQRPCDVLLSVKMKRAAELMSRGDLLAKEVADEVGYSNPLHFSRVFKRHFGVSPLLYAKEA